jgi:enamine deaminase RidA (YjgF/YER057c/UK114 family)
MKPLTPEGWPQARGYAHGMSCRGRTIYVAGQLGTDTAGKMVSENFGEQVRKALENVIAILAADGATPRHIARMNWYFTSKEEYMAERKAIGAAWKALLGDHYPTITAVEVSGLLVPGGKIEIDCIAVVPD